MEGLYFNEPYTHAGTHNKIRGTNKTSQEQRKENLLLCPILYLNCCKQKNSEKKPRAR